jgi:hypothetical protein
VAPGILWFATVSFQSLPPCWHGCPISIWNLTLPFSNRTLFVGWRVYLGNLELISTLSLVISTIIFLPNKVLFASSRVFMWICLLGAPIQPTQHVNMLGLCLGSFHSLGGSQEGAHQVWSYRILFHPLLLEEVYTLGLILSVSLSMHLPIACPREKIFTLFGSICEYSLFFLETSSRCPLV